ncbi:hypothetical protein Drose_15520 [Dactylosporangium roseum]|uniref:Uncharacterized protein n=1 Tax=Dactylosporangium roseum TaxID=47989 RepID=A0ABY5ZFQ3_9ACTN|nr:hypothetical protein [Dactylosporangium roseum]UWZ39513.1 hypothetical protein Drose_15520 [Dactylosporangium roseum]
MVLVSAAADDWLEQCRVAICAPTTAAVVLSRAGLAEPAQVRALHVYARKHSVAVVVSSPFATRALARAADDIRRDGSAAAAVDMLLTSDDDPGGRSADRLRVALLHELAVTRSLAGRPSGATVCHRSAGSYLVSGSVGRTPVLLSGVLTDTAGLRLEIDVVGSRRRWKVCRDSAAPADPTTITMLDDAGRHVTPGHYEGGERAGWLRVHDMLTSGRHDAQDLVALAGDLEIVADTLGLADEHPAPEAPLSGPS